MRAALTLLVLGLAVLAQGGAGAGRGGAALPTRIVTRKAIGTFFFALRVDYMLNDTRTCDDFWSTSGPGQTNPPAAAYRSVLKAVLGKILANDSALTTKGARIRKLTLRCREASNRFQSTLKRVTARAHFSPMTVGDINYISRSAYPAAEGRCEVTNGIRAAKAAAWEPGYFQYLPLDAQGEPTKYFAICIDKYPGCYTQPWAPPRVVGFPLVCPK